MSLFDDYTAVAAELFALRKDEDKLRALLKSWEPKPKASPAKTGGDLKAKNEWIPLFLEQKGLPVPSGKKLALKKETREMVEAAWKDEKKKKLSAADYRLLRAKAEAERAAAKLAELEASSEDSDPVDDDDGEDN